MNTESEQFGQIPEWLTVQLRGKKQESTERLEVEVKFVVPSSVLRQIRARTEGITQQLEQIYLSQEVADAFKKKVGLSSFEGYDEWRIRRIDDDQFFTAKGSLGGDGSQRREFEVGIESPLYDTIKDAAEKRGCLQQIHKTRFSYPVSFADDKVLVQFDDYVAAGQGMVELDFVICEIEVHKPELATVLMSGRFFARDLLFLKEGIDVTGISEFSNRQIAEKGFVASTFDAVVTWIDGRDLADIESAREAICRRDVEKGIRTVRAAIARVEQRASRRHDIRDADDIGFTQNVLKDLAFSEDDSLGRQNVPDRELAALDSLGLGWLRDYHQIISADFFIRLHSKPQIFRPGLGYSNTTTRGAHTSDVVANATQLARQLGLNVDLCMAAAALHDVGHPAGGHVGEEVIEQCSDRKFQHHIFSLSLADAFGLNLLKEVMLCAFHHKSGGRKLEAPEGMAQEIGVVRIADKLSYAPWDLFDSIANGYLTREEVADYTRRELGESIFDFLGDEPVKWIWKFVRAAVTESAAAHKVRFSEASGKVYKAFQAARDIVYEKVHPKIYWGSLRAAIEMVYEKIENSFSRIIKDVVPVVAYITDQELIRLATIIESEPKEKLLTVKDLRAQGFGFCDLIEKIEKKKIDPSILYYRVEDAKGGRVSAVSTIAKTCESSPP